jgi:hypothetical protein
MPPILGMCVVHSAQAPDHISPGQPGTRGGADCRRGSLCPGRRVQVAVWFYECLFSDLALAPAAHRGGAACGHARTPLLAPWHRLRHLIQPLAQAIARRRHANLVPVVGVDHHHESRHPCVLLVDASRVCGSKTRRKRNVAPFPERADFIHAATRQLRVPKLTVLVLDGLDDRWKSAHLVCNTLQKATLSVRCTLPETRRTPSIK